MRKIAIILSVIGFFSIGMGKVDFRDTFKEGILDMAKKMDKIMGGRYG